jgi:hypothetical protein
MPSLVAVTYLFLGKNFRFLSWVFTAMCCYWAFEVYRLHTQGRFEFMYWHQGDVVCIACDNSFFALAAASALFGLCVIAVVLTRLGHGRNISSSRLLIGMIALISLLFSVIAVGLS